MFWFDERAQAKSVIPFPFVCSATHLNVLCRLEKVFVRSLQTVANNNKSQLHQDNGIDIRWEAF